MTDLVIRGASLPSVFTERPQARARLRDFFSSHIRNPNTRRAYMEAVRQFSLFCGEQGILDLSQVVPVHVAAFVEAQLKLHSKPTVKVRLAALRMLFDWMGKICGQTWERFVVRRDWNFAKSGKPAAIFQKIYRSEDPAKRS